MPETRWRPAFTRCYEKELDATQQASITRSINQKLKSWDGQRTGSIKPVRNIWELEILNRRGRLLFCDHGDELRLLNILSKQNERLQYRLIEYYSGQHNAGRC